MPDPTKTKRFLSKNAVAGGVPDPRPATPEQLDQRERQWNNQRNVEYIYQQARIFAGLVYWMIDFNDKTFFSSGDKSVIPELEVGQIWPLRTIISNLVIEDRRSAMTAFKHVMKFRETSDFTLRFQRATGLHRYVEIRACPVIDAAQGLTLVQGFAREVTDRVASKMMRSQVASQYRDFVAFGPHIPWIADPAGRIVEMSPRYEMLTGQPRVVWESDAWIDHFHPSDAPGMIAAVTKSLATGQPYESEYRVRFRDGKWHWVRATAVARRDENGCIVGWYGFTEHIERRELHTTVALSNEAYPSSGKSGAPIPLSIDATKENVIPPIGSIHTETENQDPGVDKPLYSVTATAFNDSLTSIDELCQLIQDDHLSAARALAGWSMAELAKQSSLSFSTIRRMEVNARSARAKSLHSVIRTFQRAGIVFLGPFDGKIAVSKR